jgi:hypothetical protein
MDTIRVLRVVERKISRAQERNEEAREGADGAVLANLQSEMYGLTTAMIIVQNVIMAVNTLEDAV